MGIYNRDLKEESYTTESRFHLRIADNGTDVFYFDIEETEFNSILYVNGKYGVSYKVYTFVEFGEDSESNLKTKYESTGIVMNLEDIFTLMMNGLYIFFDTGKKNILSKMSDFGW